MSLYRMDCLAIQQADKRKKLKSITKHTDGELNDAIELAYRKFGDDFYLMLHGIDAYMERRRRRRNAATVLRLKRIRDDETFEPLDERVKW